MRVPRGWMRQKHGKFWRKSRQKKEKAKHGNSPTEFALSSPLATLIFFFMQLGYGAGEADAKI
jgi:hypothetical protein